MFSKCAENTKVALIDDEGDDSVNTKAEDKSYTLLYQAMLDLYDACAERFVVQLFFNLYNKKKSNILKSKGRISYFKLIIHRAAANFVYFAYTATTAACLLQQKTAKLSPDILAFMVLNQPSYLGLEHFVSPEFLSIRGSLTSNSSLPLPPRSLSHSFFICLYFAVTHTEGAVDFLEVESKNDKLKIVPHTTDLSALRSILRMYGKPEKGIEKVERDGEGKIGNEVIKLFPELKNIGTIQALRKKPLNIDTWKPDYYNILRNTLHACSVFFA